MKKQIVIRGVVIISILTLFTLMCIFLTYTLEKFEEDFEKIEYKESYHGNIIDLETNRGFIYMTFEGGDKFYVIDSKNNLYSPKHFYGFVQLGDSIVKPASTDSLYIFRNNEKYIFVIGKSIN